MKSTLYLLMILCLSCLGCRETQPSPQKPAKSPAEIEAEAKLNGRWRGKGAEGHDEWEAAFENGSLVITNRKWHAGDRYSFRLDPTQTPRAIDLVLEEQWEDKTESRPRRRFHGIYRLDPDTGKLTLRWAEEGFRPTDFVPGKGSFLVLQRVDR